jgi:Fe-S oxidoreductase
MPAFAGETFRNWFARRPVVNPDGPEVTLFADTFNNFFRPYTAIAATRVLEAGGWRVTVPSRAVCCGRPLYDWGMLDAADRLVRDLLDTLGPALARGTPIVGLEPACVAALRDEIPALFPNDERARQLRQQSVLFGEFVEQHANRVPWPSAAGGKALVQVHCHEHAVLDPDAETTVLQRLHADGEVMPNGCCGMAGSFGFEAAKYDLSVKIAEHALLPRLRQAPADAVVLANGFSCREQIEQLAGRETRHLAELMAERLGFAVERPAPPRVRAGRLLAIGAGGALAYLAWRRYSAGKRFASAAGLGNRFPPPLSNSAAAKAASPAPAANSTPR